MAVPKPRKPGQTGGAGGQRSNKGTFRKAGGNVPPPPKRPSVSGKGKGKGCALFVLALPAGLAGVATLVNHWL